MKEVSKFSNIGKCLGKFFGTQEDEVIVVKEDKTDLNLLLRKLLDDKTIEQSLVLKSALDKRYLEIMAESKEQKVKEVRLIVDYIKKE